MKKEYFILLLVIVALSLYLALGKGEDPDRDLPRMAALDNKTINRLVITRQGGPLELVKEDEQWFIQPKHYPADSVKLKNMVQAATTLTPTALVSESGNYKRYGLGAPDKIKIQIYQGDQLEREFIIGHIAPTHQHTFIMLPEDPKVYHAKGSLKSSFDQTTDALRDKTALSFEKQDIISIQIQKADHNLVLSRTEVTKDAGQENASVSGTLTQWQSPDGQPIKETTVVALLNSCAGLKCDAYMEDDAKAGLTDATWTLTFKSDSKTWALSIYGKSQTEDQKVPGVSSANNYAFLLSKSRVDAIEKNIEKLLNADHPAN